MIIENFKRIENYRDVLPHLKEALDCLNVHKEDEAGRYEFQNGFILIQEGTTTDITKGHFEAHRNYLDIQILLGGSETIAWADIEDLECSEAYDLKMDKAMYTGEGCCISIKPGMFYICYPHDAHKACGHIDSEVSFRKAVVKLRLEEYKSDNCG